MNLGKAPNKPVCLSVGKHLNDAPLNRQDSTTGDLKKIKKELHFLLRLQCDTSCTFLSLSDHRIEKKKNKKTSVSRSILAAALASRLQIRVQVAPPSSPSGTNQSSDSSPLGTHTKCIDSPHTHTHAQSHTGSNS